MKKVFAVLLAVLMVAAIFAGCQTPNTKNTLTEKNLSDDRLYDIQVAFFDREGYPGKCWSPWFSEGYGFGLHYMGSANGYDFVDMGLSGIGTIDGNTVPTPPSHTLGDVEFQSCDNPTIFGYKDGAIYSMDELYEKGDISQELLCALRDAHSVCNEKINNVTNEQISAGYQRWEENYLHFGPHAEEDKS